MCVYDRLTIGFEVWRIYSYASLKNCVYLYKYNFFIFGDMYCMRIFSIFMFKCIHKNLYVYICSQNKNIF